MKQTKFKSVYENVGKKDTSYYIKYKKDGNNHSFCVGKKSEGMTAKKAFDILEERRTSDSLKVEKKITTKQVSLQSLAESYFKDIEEKALSEEGKDEKEKIFKTLINVKKERSLYKNIWEKWEFKRFSLHKIQEVHVTSFLSELQKTKSQKYIYNGITLIKSILKFSIEEGLISKSFESPFSFSKQIDRNKFKKPTESNRKLFLTKEQIQSVLSHLKEHSSFQNYLIVFLSLSTGARPNSILHIKLEDIDFSRDSLRLYDFKRKMFYHSHIDETMKEVLQKHISKRKNHKEFLFFSTDPFKPLCDFPKPIQRTLDVFVNKGKREGEERAIFYSFRHTFANILIYEYKTPIFEVSKLLNHSSVDTTIKNYVTFDPYLVKESIQGYKNLIGESLK